MPSKRHKWFRSRPKILVLVLSKIRRIYADRHYNVVLSKIKPFIFKVSLLLTNTLQYFNNRNPQYRKAYDFYDFTIRGVGIAHLGCLGTEDDISDCRPINTWGTNTCGYTDFVGIACGNTFVTTRTCTRSLSHACFNFLLSV